MESKNKAGAFKRAADDIDILGLMSRTQRQTNLAPRVFTIRGKLIGAVRLGRPEELWPVLVLLISDLELCEPRAGRGTSVRGD